MRDNKKPKQKIIIAMSGGVDSSVAAKIVKDQGYDAMGIFLHFWKETPGLSSEASELSPFQENFENKCCSAKAFMDARRVCQKIGINLYTLNFAKEFKKEIVDNFINEYKIGNTPNPCVRCNKLVKLGLLVKRAKKLGYDKVASGHYARLRREIINSKSQTLPAGRQVPKYKLYRAKDKDKDQSYFLWSLTQEQLKHLLFPLGNYTKPEVRRMAKKFKLPVAEKKESQEVCFIPEKGHNEFLKRYIKLKEGDIKTMDGKTIGKHQGLSLYTIGQRRGIEIGGTGPYYAAGFDYKKNILYVVNNFDDPALYKDELIAKNINWISGISPKMPFKCEAVIRYRHKPVKCEVAPITHPLPPLKRGLNTPLRKGGRGVKYLVKFSKPQRAVTPGQSVVFYREDEVLGGGVIS